MAVAGVLSVNIRLCYCTSAFRAEQRYRRHAAPAIDPALTACLVIFHRRIRPAREGQGVDVGKPSALRNLVPAEQIENSATQEYQALLRQAASKRALAPADDPQVQRLRRIADQLIPHVKAFNAPPCAGSGDQPDRLEADQRLLHAGRKDRFLPVSSTGSS